MMKKVLIGLSAAAILSGCGLFGSGPDVHAYRCSKRDAAALASRYGESSDFGCLVYAATGKLMAKTNGPIVRNRPILVSTLVSVDDYKVTSSLGRLAGQLVASRLSQLGYTVQDATYTGALTISPESGETVLSRNVKNLGDAAKAQAVVAGTYAMVGQKVYLSIRLLRADNGMLLSSADIVLPRLEYDPDFDPSLAQ